MNDPFQKPALLLLLILCMQSTGEAQQSEIGGYLSSSPGIRELPYKQVDSLSLLMKLYYPLNFREDEVYPAIVFFFGGGWNSRNLTQFEPHADYFASRGMIGILADYRVRNSEGTSPFDAVEDAKSVLRFLKIHGEQLNIDTGRIVASGGSAGGHLAAAAALVRGLNNPSEDLSVSPKPMALVLFNPVFDNGPGGYGYERIGERYLEISPLHNIREGAPPTIVFLGTEDRLIPVRTAERYQAMMDSAGSRCELFLYEGQGHGFFNYRHREYFNRTLLETDRFLQSLGLIK